MKSVAKVYKNIGPEVEPSIPVKCPYCGIITVVNRLLTDPACNHFEDFVLFKEEGDIFSEIDDYTDKVVCCEVKFRLSGSKIRGITKASTGQLILSDDGMDGAKLMVDGKFECFISPEDREKMIADDDDEDTEYIKDD